MLQKNNHQGTVYRILQDIFSWEYKINLALWWDTLGYYIYNLNHFSAHLSIDIVRKINDELLFQEYLESIFTLYTKILAVSKVWNIIFFTLQYWDSDTNIIIEIHLNIWTENQYEIVNFYGLELLAQEKSTLFANKLVDFTSKKILSGRDIYDVYFYFTQQFAINHILIQERAKRNLREYLIFLLGFLEKNVNPETPITGLEELLDTKQMQFAQEKLLNELVILIQYRINEIQ